MSTQDVLSQDEIDALLDGVNDGSVETENDSQLNEACEEYDFANQDAVFQCSLPGLDLINERFVRTYRTSLYTLLKKPVDVETKGIKALRFSEYIESLKPPSSFNLLRLRALQGLGLLVFTPSLVYCMVDAFFGGTGRSFSNDTGRQYTETDNGIVRLLTQAALSDMRTAWEPTLPLRMELVGQEVNPSMAQICSLKDVLVICTFDVQTEKGGGEFQLAIPMTLLDPIREKLDDTTSTEDSGRDNRWTMNLHAQAMGAYVDMRARLPAMTMTLRDLVRMNEGDVITIDEPRLATVFIEGVPTMQARLGRSRNFMALQIERFLSIQQASEATPNRGVANKKLSSAPVLSGPDSNDSV